MASANHISKKAKDVIAKVDGHKESKAKADTDDESKSFELLVVYNGVSFTRKEK